jgi:hypothetical protein
MNDRGDRARSDGLLGWNSVEEITVRRQLEVGVATADPARTPARGEVGGE